MTPAGPSPEGYDVFLAHGSGDKSLVKELYDALAARGFSVFLDSEELSGVWRPALERALELSRCIALCVGPAGPGPWTELEIDFALRRNREDPTWPVIPVMFPGSSQQQLKLLSPLLESFQAVELTSEAAIEKLANWIERARTGAWVSPRDAGQVPQGDAQRGLQRLQERFVNSLRPLLAGGRQIERAETAEILRLLETTETRTVVVHGSAGCGKSGLLLELVDQLAKRGTPHLPLRLDRCKLAGTPLRFAATELHLPGAPGQCLASLVEGGPLAVLILDQLDALRWTGAHSSEAWDVCRELIQDALASSPKIKIVVCCRSFDLQHDPQLKAWKAEEQRLRELPLGDLTDQQVRAAVDRVASSLGEARELQDRELALLRHVHHLQMWLSLYPSIGPAGSLSTKRALMEAFWQDRRQKLQDRGVTPDRIERIEQRLIEGMEHGARLTAPLSSLRFTSREAEAYQSLHVLQIDPASNQVTFSHQSYLDYLVVLDVVANLNGVGGLFDWLGPRERQHLFRREQLRLLLEELRDRDASDYLAVLRGVLEASELRFHLRLLCLQFLSQVATPLAEERDLVLALLDEPYWHHHVLDEVVRGQRAWFEVLDDAGILERWLAGTNAEKQATVLNLSRFVTRSACGDRVARLLKPYLDIDEEWARKISWTLGDSPEEDTEDLFKLRLQLTERGIFAADYVDWSDLAQRYPERFLQLATGMLKRFARELEQERKRKRPGRRSELSWLGFEKVTADILPSDRWEVFWAELAEAVTCVARHRDYEGEETEVLESFAFSFETIEPVITLLRGLGRHLLERNWQEFVALAARTLDSSRAFEILLLDSLTLGPQQQDFADWAMGWVMAEPWRPVLRLQRNSGKWRLSGLLIERLSSACSNEIFLSLEAWLLTYCGPDFAEIVKHRHSRFSAKDRLTPNPYGRTAHALLGKLPQSRRSDEASRRMKELVRKFGERQASDHREGREEMGGLVTSPLKQQARDRMSDRGWLALARSPKIPSEYRPSRWKDDHFESASISTLAADFRHAAEREPERFARMVLRWPRDGEAAFLNAILSGLDSRPEKDRQGSPANWLPPSQEALEALFVAPPVLALLVHDEYGTEATKSLCDLLQRYAEYPWSQQVLEFLSRAAIEHSDPAPGYFPIDSNRPDAEDFDDLESNALNVARGRAAFAIEALLYKHPEFFPSLAGAIEHLVRDPHAAVRVAAACCCVPLLNFDKDIAFKRFLEVCAWPEDRLLTTRGVWRFLQFSYRSDLDRLLPLLDRMVASSIPQVATIGAQFSSAAFFLDGAHPERFDACLAGTEAQRKGAALVAAEFLTESDCAEKAKQTLLLLADDPDTEVRLAVAQGFKKLDLRLIQADAEAWRRFARSRAFQEDPTYLLIALDQQSGSLLPFADCLLAAATTFAEDLPDKVRDPAGRFRFDTSHYLLPLLLRLYEQAASQSPQLVQQCLDLWDRLLEQRVGSAIGLTRELDRF